MMIMTTTMMMMKTKMVMMMMTDKRIKFFSGSLARGGASLVRKCGKLPIGENLVNT